VFLTESIWATDGIAETISSLTPAAEEHDEMHVETLLPHTAKVGVLSDDRNATELADGVCSRQLCRGIECVHLERIILSSASLMSTKVFFTTTSTRSACHIEAHTPVCFATGEQFQQASVTTWRG
jgi:hypothetical protein